MMIADNGDIHPRRRGRPRVRRRLSEFGNLRCYGPRCLIPMEVETVSLLREEIEVLRLVDLEGMEQEEAAAFLGVSRRTVWKDLHEARRKVADALVNGKLIEVSGCNRQGEGECPKNHDFLCPRDASICPRNKDTEDDESSSPDS